MSKLIKHQPQERVLTDEQVASIQRRDKNKATHGVEPSPQVTSPSLPRKAWHAAMATGRVAGAIMRGRPVKVPEEERQRRFAICRQCEFWREEGNAGLGECGHSQCGCTRFKHGLATEKCPLGKWETSESK